MADDALQSALESHLLDPVPIQGIQAFPHRARRHQLPKIQDFVGHDRGSVMRRRGRISASHVQAALSELTAGVAPDLKIY